jgi:flagellin
MSTIGDKALSARLNRNLRRAQEQQADSLSKLSSGNVFTAEDPRPSERALAENMEYRIRSLAASKRNINDTVSLLQTAEDSMSEISNMVTRMKEINVSAASTNVSDQERRFLFVEYQALHDEINRITKTTEFNGLPLLNGEDPAVPEEMVFRVGDPSFTGNKDDDADVNTIRFGGLKSISTSTNALGIQNAGQILADSSETEGIRLNDVEEMLSPPDSNENFKTVYDQALNTIATHRAIFGALQTRLNHSLSYIDVYQENIAAAKSRIADTDYADEVTKLTAAKIATEATTAMLAQSNMNASLTQQLIHSLF